MKWKDYIIPQKEELGTTLSFVRRARFFAGQCPWAVSGKRGQNVRAAVAVGAVYTVSIKNVCNYILIGYYAYTEVDWF